MNLKLSTVTIEQLRQLKESTGNSFNKLTTEAINKYYLEQTSDTK